MRTHLRVLAFLAWSIGAMCSAWAAPPLPVGFETREFVDESRSNWQNTGHRPLSTVIWYPPALPSAQAQRYPTVLLSHGSTSVNLSLSWLGAYLAEHGYIAAAVNHHGNTRAEAQLLSQGFMAPWERVVDLSALLDRMLADPKFGSHIDQRRVFAAGHSAGGATVIMLAGGQFSGDEIAKFCTSTGAADASCEPRALIQKAIAELEELRKHDPAVQASLARAARPHRDERIRAVVAMAPAVGPAFTEATLRAIAVPVFIVTAKVDAVTPPATNALRYAQFIPGAQLLTVPGNADHLSFVSGEGTDRKQVHELVAQRVLEFFAQH